jgi:thiamine kinase-like enzyme
VIRERIQGNQRRALVGASDLGQDAALLGGGAQEHREERQKLSALADFEVQVATLPLWRGKPRIAPLGGGLSNLSLVVTDAAGKYVVRSAADFPFHGVSREREAGVARAAHAAGFSPEVLYAGAGVMVSRFIEGEALTEADVRADIGGVARLVRSFHDSMPAHVQGSAGSFEVFGVIDGYARILKRSRNPLAAGVVPELIDISEQFRRVELPARSAFAHNDLLAGNIIKDGDRLWLIDFEYAGLGNPLFDLANLASNSTFSAEHSEALLEAYFGRPPDDGLRAALAAMQCASLLREALWSLVSEMHLSVPGADYDAYARHNLMKLETALAAYHRSWGD